MRREFRRNQQTHARELVIKPARGEVLVPAQAQWLKDQPETTLLSFAYELGQDMSTKALVFDVEGYVSLRRFVRRHRVNSWVLMGMVEDVERAVNACADAGLSYLSILFDTKYVFVNRDCRLRFAFVPLDGMTFKSENTPLTVLRFLSNAKRLRLKSPSDVMACERLGDYVFGERGVFSPNGLTSFVHSMAREKGEPGRTRGLREGVPRLARACSPKTSYVLRDLRREEAFCLADDAREIVGRGHGCTVRLDLPRVSREHIALVVRKGEVFITDLGSTNGTYVGGSRIAPHEEARVELGQTFVLCDEPFCVDIA